MTLVESSVPIDAESDSEALGLAINVARDSARRLYLDNEGFPPSGAADMQETSDEIMAQVPRVLQGGDDTGYKTLDEPVVGEAVVFDDVVVASAVVNGKVAANIIFTKDGTSMPGMALLEQKATKLTKLIPQALAGAKEFLRRG